MQSLLKEYVRLVLETVVTTEESSETGDAENEDDLCEFSGAGAAAGYTLPLGASKDDIEVHSTKRSQRRS